ncbi:hypothetical protein AAFF_G00128070 [Aldrovandia affinis]|uniref:Uncharacterized protein n=1 Tax=Aldrovandia affinis TaxID=143900 RepID=A0AAD7T166_9TELE|nr:hypothetical protein AAFF_G00128070 [Aldrovandia affinis]
MCARRVLLHHAAVTEDTGAVSREPVRCSAAAVMLCLQRAVRHANSSGVHRKTASINDARPPLTSPPPGAQAA